MIGPLPSPRLCSSPVVVAPASTSAALAASTAAGLPGDAQASRSTEANGDMLGKADLTRSGILQAKVKDEDTGLLGWEQRHLSLTTSVGGSAAAGQLSVRRHDETGPVCSSARLDTLHCVSPWLGEHRIRFDLVRTHWQYRTRSVCWLRALSHCCLIHCVV